MTRTKSNGADLAVATVRQMLKAYTANHSGAKTDVYRYNDSCIRVRIIDPGFAGLERIERHDLIWTLLEELPEDVMTQVTLLVLLVPSEVKTSLGNLEFSNPSPPLGVL